MKEKSVLIITPNALGDSLYMMLVAINLQSVGYVVTIISNPIFYLYGSDCAKVKVSKNPRLINLMSILNTVDYVWSFCDRVSLVDCSGSLSILLPKDLYQKIVICNLTKELNKNPIGYIKRAGHPFNICRNKGLNKAFGRKKIGSSIECFFKALDPWYQMQNLPHPMRQICTVNNKNKRIVVFDVKTSCWNVGKTKVWPIRNWRRLELLLERDGFCVLWNLSQKDTSHFSDFVNVSNQKIFSGNLQ